MLSAHYRSPINFSAEQLQQAENGLERMYKCVENLEHLKNNAAERDGSSPGEISLKTD